MILREYQQAAKSQIRAKFTDGHKRVVLCSPTGAGKTVTFASIAADAVRSGTTVVIVVDRRELLQQAREKLVECGLNPALITAGQRTFQSSSYIATVETLVRRPQIVKRLQETKRLLIVIDECHKQTFDKLLESESFQHAFVIGASATPKRHGKMTQLSKHYHDIVAPTTISELIALGFLVPAITYGAPFNVSNISVKRGEFDSRSMFNEFEKSVLYSGVVEKYMKHANGSKSLCFCVNVEHSIKTRDAFRSRGIRAEHIDGSTPDALRRQIIGAFKSGSIDVLCNCEILTTGFDEETIETVIVNRATKSLTLWLQMCGRGSRPTKDGRKTHFSVIDLGGNVFRLGFWETDHVFSLHHKTKEKADAAPLKECPNCNALIHLSTMKCQHCGFVFEKVERKLTDAEFVPLVNQQDVPENLRGKNLNEMTLVELEQFREFKKYKLGWIVRLIAGRPDLSLEQFAQLKGYKSSWITIQKSIYQL